ncbi:MAG TPA: hypothetical protein VFH41_06590 [Bradyrhizobium sp.]|nr:hypothetical protein [Bradyrhizobium sp.]
MKSRFTVALALLTLVLSACSHRGETPVSSLNEDDDVVCRANNVAPGSPEYVACIKNRDAQRANTISRADSAQRRLGQYMIDHPERP